MKRGLVERVVLLVVTLRRFPLTSVVLTRLLVEENRERPTWVQELLKPSHLISNGRPSWLCYYALN